MDDVDQLVGGAAAGTVGDGGGVDEMFADLILDHVESMERNTYSPDERQ